MSIDRHIEEHAALGLPFGQSKSIKYVGRGAYPTIQAAIDSIPDGSTWEAYVPTSFPTICNSWAINTSDLVTDSFVGIFAATENWNRLWFQLAGDTHKYPVESLSQNVPGMRSRIQRIEASVTGTPAISYFLEKPVQIVLTDGYVYEQTVNINKNISIIVSSAGRTDLGVGFKLGASCTQGRLTLGKGLDVNSTGILTVVAISPTGRSFLFDMEYCTWGGIGTDGSGFNYLGGLNFSHVDFVKGGGTPLSHFILGQQRGDIRIKNCSLKFLVNAISGTSFLFIDQLVARKTIIQGLNVEIVDPNSAGVKVTVVGQSSAQINTGSVHISGMRVISSYPTNSAVRIFDDSTSDASETATNHVYITDSHIEPDNITGVKHIYRTSPVSSTMNGHVSMCSGGVVDVPSLGSMTTAYMP